MSITPFQPPVRTLMGPGPSDVHARILEAMSRPTIGHLDPAFVGFMDELKSLLHYAFRTENPLTLPISAPGSAGMEACFVNLVSPGDKVLVCVNGVFGLRMIENVNRCGGELVQVDDEWGKPVDADKVAQALKENPDVRFVAFVQAETSTGTLSDVEAITKVAHENDCLVIVDAVTSLGGVPLRVDDWNVDAIYSGSQKCLSCTPGISPVSFNDRATDVIQNREAPVQSWFLDMNLVMGYWGSGATRSYHHTAPINALYGLHEALLMLQEEGLEASWQRHHDMHALLRDGLMEMGIDFLVEEPHRLPQLNAVFIPEGVDDGEARSRLLNEFNLEIGAGLGPLAGKVWRIGLMGYSAREENVELCLRAIREVTGR